MRKRPAIARFHEKIVVTESGCWEWQGARGHYGHGRLKVDGRLELAYRFSYRHWKGEIPDGYHIDHLCRNPPCCNPDHLEAVPPAVNILRSEGPAAQNKRKTHCKRGHEFTPENTGYQKTGHRYCKTCQKMHTSRWAKENADRMRELQVGWRERNPERVRELARESMRRAREKRRDAAP